MIVRYALALSRCIGTLMISWLLLAHALSAQETLPLHSQLASGSLLDRPESFRKLQQTFFDDYSALGQQGVDFVRARLREARTKFMRSLNISIAEEPAGTCTLVIAVNGKSETVSAGSLTLDSLFDKVHTALGNVIDSRWDAAFTGSEIVKEIGDAATTSMVLAGRRNEDDTPGKIIARLIMEEVKLRVIGWLKAQGEGSLDWKKDAAWCGRIAPLKSTLISELTQASKRIDETIAGLFDGVEQALVTVLDEIEGIIRLPDASFSLVGGSGNLGGGVQVSYWRSWMKASALIQGDLNPQSPTKGVTGLGGTLRLVFNSVEISGLGVLQFSGGSMNSQFGVELTGCIANDILLGASVVRRTTGLVNPSLSATISVKGASPQSPIVIAGVSFETGQPAYPLFQVLYPLSSLE